MASCSLEVYIAIAKMGGMTWLANRPAPTKWCRRNRPRPASVRARTRAIVVLVTGTQCAIRDDQPDAREGQAGRVGVAERPVIPMKPGNAGGGKEPQFKTGARRGEGPGDWAT